MRCLKLCCLCVLGVLFILWGTLRIFVLWVGKISPPTGIRSRTVQPVASRYTDWAIAVLKKYSAQYLMQQVARVNKSNCYCVMLVDGVWYVMAHGDAREGKWRGNWRMEWVASTLHTTSEHGVSSITTADANTSAASSRLNWRPPPI